MNLFKLRSGNGFIDSSYFELARLLIKHQLESYDITPFLNNETCLVFDYELPNKPVVHYNREESITKDAYHGEFNYMTRKKVNPILEEVHRELPLNNFNQITDQEFQIILDNQEIVEILKQNNSRERAEVLIEPYLIFHLSRRLSNSLRQKIYEKIMEHYNLI